MSGPIQDYTRFFNTTALARNASPLHSLMPLLRIPGMISLGGGLPNSENFPFQELSVTLKSGKTVRIADGDLQAALQYSESPGLPALLEFLGNLQRAVHNPPLGMDFYSICSGNGSQDLFTRAFDMFIERGDYILVESPTYAGALAALAPFNCNLIGIEIDGDGLIPSSLERELEKHQTLPKPPKILYTVPNGGNPTGASLTLERKKEIYRLAQKFDLLIMEDDPYFYLQFGERTPSFLSIDTDGRVLRFDSFSKIVSSGIRMGFTTGPKPLVDRLERHISVTSLHTSGVSQILLIEVLKDLGIEGFMKHVDGVAEFYRKRMEIFLASANKHLKGLVEWNLPKAGMFFWLKLLNIDDSYDLISKKALEQKVLLIPGFMFFPQGEKTPYVRASFSSATPEQMDEALRRLALLLKRDDNQEQGEK